MAKYRMYLSQVWTYSTEIEAESYDEAEEMAYEIASDMTPMNSYMKFGDEYIDVDRIPTGE